MPDTIRRDDLFNTPLESGLRTLIVLLQVSPASCDLHRLKIYDYLLIHSGDVSGGPASIHPPTPFRSGELLVRQGLIEKGLALLMSKGLVERVYDERGIQYKATPLAAPFLNYFESPYASRATSAAQWLALQFGSMPDDVLQTYVNENIGKWGAEFTGNFILDEDVE